MGHALFSQRPRRGILTDALVALVELALGLAFMCQALVSWPSPGARLLAIGAAAWFGTGVVLVVDLISRLKVARDDEKSGVRFIASTLGFTMFWALFLLALACSFVGMMISREYR